MLDLVLIQLPEQRVLHCPQPPLKTNTPLLHGVAHYIAEEKLFHEFLIPNFSPDVTSLEVGSALPKAGVCAY